MSEGVIMSGVSTDSGSGYAVGGFPSSGFLMRLDEEGWDIEAEFQHMVHWVHSIEDDLWIVGAGGLIVQFEKDGARIDHSLPEITTEFWGVFALAHDNVWVVGGNPRATGRTEAVIMRYDGDRWVQVELPALDRPCPSLFKIWGRHENNLYLVGANGVLITFNGTELVQTALDFGDDLVSVWGNEQHTIIVGGRTRGVILTETADQWRVDFLNRTSGLNGIWVGDRDAVSVGHQGHIVTWSLSEPEEKQFQKPVPILLHGIFEHSTRELIVTGGTLDQPQPWQPILLQGEL